MDWKSVAWACLLPVLAGCGSVHKRATVTQSSPAPTTFAYDSHNDANSAWAIVRAQHPNWAFSDEFRSGFQAGYADYLDLGSSAAPPAVPPASYSRYKKYLTVDGDRLVRDYYLGFQYGIDVAISGRRRTGSDTLVQTDSPRPAPGASKFGVSTQSKQNGSDDSLPVSPVPEKVGRAIPPLPKPELPVIKPFNPNLPDVGKYIPTPVPSSADLLPAPNPPLPIPLPVPTYKVALPALDAAPPPAYVPAPPFLEQLPVIPFQYTPPSPIPIGNSRLEK